MKTNKTISSILIILFVISIISGCGSYEEGWTNISSEENKKIISTDIQYETFENICAYATDIVIARYVSHKPYGGVNFTTEYEFTVIDRILGDAPEKIKVYSLPDFDGTYTGISVEGDTDYIFRFLSKRTW